MIERSFILSEQEEIMLEHLPSDLQHITADRNQSHKLSPLHLAGAEKVLLYTNGNKTEAARLLNIALTTLYRKLDDYKIG